jgi:hypothetical protein
MSGVGSTEPPTSGGAGSAGTGAGMGAKETEEALGRVEELLERLKAAREELERLAAAEDAEAAVDVLAELAELSKDVELELAKARDRADRPSA